jgi:hypothetical protein
LESYSKTDSKMAFLAASLFLNLLTAKNAVKFGGKCVFKHVTAKFENIEV